MSGSILHLTAPAPFGGLERVVETLAGAQHEHGREVRVMALLTAGSAEPPFLGRLRERGVTVEPVVLPGRAYAAQLRRLRSAGSRGAATVVHSHGYHPDVLSALLGRWVGVGRVSTVHGFTGGGWRNRLYEWAQCRAYARLDAVVAVSRRLAADLAARGVAPSRLHTLPNAWAGGVAALAREEARRLLQLPPDGFAIGWVGRASREKGLDLMIEALAGLRDLPVHLSVLGDGPEIAAARERARQLGAEAHVRFHGAVPDASRLLRAFDLVVLSSRTEGTPMVLLEAMELGVPVLATAVGGVPDVITSDEALLVGPEDPVALARAIREARGTPERAAERARRAAERLRSGFAVEPWLRAYDDIYETARRRAARST